MNEMLMEMTRAGGSSTHPVAELPERIVRQELKWLDLSKDRQCDDPLPRVSATRWEGFTSEAREQAAEIDAGCHVLGIALRPMDLTAFAGHKLIHDGRMPQGTMRLIEPGSAMRGIFRGGYDALHLHIPNPVIAECVEAGCGPSRDSPLALAGLQPHVDPVIERLACALLRADDFGGSYGHCYADSVGLAIVARLLGRTAGSGPTANTANASKLPKWRLRRATDYIAAHLGEPIGLAEIAASTGLTRMHFAAQFRASTGLRPHEYLVRRRIERAQELLASSDLPLSDIALAVGFKAQAHFTTVFARVAGATPNAWRRQNYTGSEHGLVAEFQ